MTKRDNPVSVSTLLRWERDGSIKAEDAWHLSQVYGMTLDELLLSGEPVPEPQPTKHAGSAAVASARDKKRVSG